MSVYIPLAMAMARSVIRGLQNLTMPEALGHKHNTFVQVTERMLPYTATVRVLPLSTQIGSQDKSAQNYTG